MASESRESDPEPETAGTLADTYVAAIQHDLADVPDDATLVGVVRKPAPWFHAAVDENHPVLGPPADLLESMRDREEDMKMQGLCEEGAQRRLGSGRLRGRLSRAPRDVGGRAGGARDVDGTARVR